MKIIDIKNYIMIQFAKVILKTISEDAKRTSRKLERTVNKYIYNDYHLGFSLACFNNDLLPIYTNTL